MSQPLIQSPTEGEVFECGPFHIVSRVPSTQSDSTFEMHELTLGAATIDYHIHRKMDETLYVLEGQIEFNVAGKKFLRPAGSVAFVPRGVHHGFSNLGPAKARVLIVFSPAGTQHEYFRALAKLLAAPALDKPALAALQKKYDQELIPQD